MILFKENNMDEFEKKIAQQNLTLDLYEEIVRDDFSSHERLEWEKCLAYFKIDLKTITDIMANEINTDLPYSPNLSFSKVYGNFENMLDIYKLAPENKIINRNFYILLYTGSLILQQKLNGLLLSYDASDSIKETVFKAQYDTLLKGSRLMLSKDLITTNYPSIRTFLANDDINFSFSRLRKNLKKNFLSADLDKDSFQIVFSLIPINSNFKPISWRGSIIELVYFLRQMEKKILIKDKNYKYTLMDCFLIYDKPIQHNQFDSPTGSKKRFPLIDKSISDSFIK